MNTNTPEDLNAEGASCGEGGRATATQRGICDKLFCRFQARAPGINFRACLYLPKYRFYVNTLEWFPSLNDLHAKLRLTLMQVIRRHAS
jgi:hypothetical protein